MLGVKAYHRPCCLPQGCHESLGRSCCWPQPLPLVLLPCRCPSPSLKSCFERTWASSHLLFEHACLHLQNRCRGYILAARQPLFPCVSQCKTISALRAELACMSCCNVIMPGPKIFHKAQLYSAADSFGGMQCSFWQNILQHIIAHMK